MPFGGTIQPMKDLSKPVLVVQWLRRHAPNAGGPCSIPGQGTKSHVSQLRVQMLQLKTQSATTKTQLSRKNKQIYIFLNVSLSLF